MRRGLVVASWVGFRGGLANVRLPLPKILVKANEI